MDDVTTVRFYGNAEDRTLKIETDGAVVHVQAGLVNAEGHALTRVDVTPDGEQRGGDADGRIWRIVESSPGVVRVVRYPSPVEVRGRADGGGHWSLVFSTGEPTDKQRRLIAAQIRSGADNGTVGVEIPTSDVGHDGGLGFDLTRRCDCGGIVACTWIDTGDEKVSACTRCGGYR